MAPGREQSGGLFYFLPLLPLFAAGRDKKKVRKPFGCIPVFFGSLLLQKYGLPAGQACACFVNQQRKGERSMRESIKKSYLPSSRVTKTLVCIDENIDHDLSGTFYNPFMEQAGTFTGFLDFAAQMDSFFDRVAFPQAFHQRRSFCSRKNAGPQKTGAVRFWPNDILTEHRGKLATFLIQVHFRRSATWQGTVTWVEQNRTVRFASFLELSQLIADALPKRDAPGWD